MPNRNYWWFVKEEGEGEMKVFVQASPRKTDDGERFVCPRSRTEMPMVEYLESTDTKETKEGEKIHNIKVRISV